MLHHYDALVKLIEIVSDKNYGHCLKIFVHNCFPTNIERAFRVTMVNELCRQAFDSITPLSKVKRGVNISSSKGTLASCHYSIRFHVVVPKNEVQEDYFLKEHQRDHRKKLHDYVRLVLPYTIVEQNDEI